MKSTFESKEQYRAFRSAWAAAVNDPRSKSTLAPHDEMVYDGATNRYTESKGTGQHRVKGWLKPEHHMLFNIMRGKDISTGFTAITNQQKINSNADNPSFSFKQTKSKLVEIIYIAQQLTGKRSSQFDDPTKELTPYQIKVKDARLPRVEKFLAPFNGSITIEQLSNIDTSCL